MGRYANLDGTTPDKGLADILRWRLGRLRSGRHREGREFVTPRRDNDGHALRSAEPSLTWVGHATFVQRLGGRLIATDPIWSESIERVIERRTAPGVSLRRIPQIDVVTISHSHYDHFDLPTLRRIGNDAVYIVPAGNGDILRSEGFAQIVELDWWDTFRVPGGQHLTMSLVPAQHWSMRTLWDRNDRLWGGFVYAGPEGTSYHAGDTAFSEDLFREIGERFQIDWAMLPIGAYEPEWFMQSQHMGPEEAGRAWELLGAKNLCAMHWGTFDLADEPPGDPPARLRAWWSERGLDPERLWIFDVGETRRLAR